MNNKKKALYVIILILIIIILTLIFTNIIPIKDNFTNYKGFEYSNKLSIEDIKNIKKGQRKMGIMLKKFDEICQKHKIRYFLIAGSLIGVLVYNGWIPWDGDVDLEVHEDDYNRLKKALKTELPETMWFQDRETDPNYKDRILGKLRDLNSCYKDYPYVGKKSHQGLQIDINIYKEKKNGKIYFPDDKRIKNLKKSDIYPLKRVKFVNDHDKFYVSIMNNPEKYLDHKYGKGWRTILPVNQRFSHEGKMDANKTCDFHFEKYPKIYKK